jgi:hypothetical protein
MSKDTKHIYGDLQPQGARLVINYVCDILEGKKGTVVIGRDSDGKLREFNSGSEIEVRYPKQGLN